MTAQVTRDDTRKVLGNLKFGSGVAEHEQHLKDYFLRTSLYKRVVNDELDLVRGVKGSGKSAMFRYLQQDQHPAKADVVVVPAFDFGEDEAFQRIIKAWSGATEDTLRRRWRVYLLALVGNELVERFGGHEAVAELSAYLETLHLRQPVRGRLSRLIQKFREAPIAWDEEDDDDRIESVTQDLAEVAAATRDALAALNRRAWVVFDRLDEAFYTDVAAERQALRSLMQVTRDLNAADPEGRRIRVKLFMREDIFNRISRGGSQVNLSHIRDADLRWYPDTLSELLCRRVIQHEDHCRLFRLKPSHAKTTAGRSTIISTLLPEATPFPLPCRDNHVTATTWNWVMTYLRDGKGYVSPRNLLTFFDIACREQEDMWEDDGDRGTRDALLGGKALNRAWRTLSRERMEDTVVAEDGELEPYIDRLMNGAYRYRSPQAVSARLECTGDDLRFERVFDRLLAAGVLTKLGGGQYSIAYLYRPVLNVDPTLD
ncbi:MAG: hypothetical protein M3320_06715 [Actinomycetota bacterium]|nr:hypothetical protein [Actinomycetota bacterium]